MTKRSQMSRLPPQGSSPHLAPNPDGARKRVHLPGAERELQIVEAASVFFAESGFAGQTRELAKTMGITHSAIFRYFPTKDALIERVYEHVFLDRWNPAWRDLILDRSQSLEQRLLSFYRAYADRIFDDTWVRIFMHSGLSGYSIAPRYMALVREQLILPACGELRAELDLPSPHALPITEREQEAFWGLHGKVFYLAIRRFIYRLPVPTDVQSIIEDDVRVFLHGVSAVAVQSCTTPTQS